LRITLPVRDESKPYLGSIQDILILNSKRYPGWKEQDLYKLIYQAGMGNEHAITDEAGVRRWMERELLEMGNGPDEPLIDPISPDEAVVRVHLRPLVKAKLDPALVLQAFLDSSKVFHGSKELLEKYMASALELARMNDFSFSEAQLSAYFDQMRTLNLPAVHHSPEYEEAYRPAYRVVARAALPKEFE
jgi:hypothetical protein